MIFKKAGRGVYVFVIGIMLGGLAVNLYAENTPKEEKVKLAKERFKAEDQDESEVDTNKTIIGAVEKVRVIPGNFVMKARIDTGASMTSIGVDNDVEIVNEDGQDWAYVTINDIKMKHKVVKYIYVKQHGSDSHKRPVIRLKLILGNVAQNVNVTLADRSNFQYQLLIGRNLLYDHFAVDVSQKYTTPPMEYKEK
ncbi:MAG: ATP-dependent zinc protease [Campylobacterales bacterium]|nr:ATP-dependent zinc protease [Campylobacterales bacterium]